MRADAMHRAFYKLWINSVLSRDRFVLSEQENSLGSEAFGFQCVAVVPTAQLSRKVGIRGAWNVIHHCRDDVFIWPIDRNSTITFLRETLAEGLKPEQTQLFESVRRGDKHTRHLSGNRGDKRDLTEATFDAYYRKCLEQAEHISRKGFQTSDADRRQRRDEQIGVAIMADGELAFHDVGRHRIGIARALKIPHVPVRPRVISGAYVRTFLHTSDLVVPSRIIGAVKQSWQTALENAGGGWETGDSSLSSDI